MASAVKKETEDIGQAAPDKEFEVFHKWADSDLNKLSRESQQVMFIYRKHAKKARAKGKTSFSGSDFNKMIEEMRSLGKTR